MKFPVINWQATHEALSTTPLPRNIKPESNSILEYFQRTLRSTYMRELLAKGLSEEHGA
jgi:hypothetical protein